VLLITIQTSSEVSGSARGVTIRYDTIEEFNVDSKAEYTA